MCTSSDWTHAEETKMVTAGKFEFQQNCVMCHGPQGKGDGEVVSLGLLTSKPPDLTQIRKRHDGQFPFQQIYRIIDGRAPVEGYRTPDMPIWGETFLQEASMTFSPPSLEIEMHVQDRILSLVHYLQSIQE